VKKGKGKGTAGEQDFSDYSIDIGRETQGTEKKRGEKRRKAGLFFPSVAEEERKKVADQVRRDTHQYLRYYLGKTGRREVNDKKKEKKKGGGGR